MRSLRSLKLSFKIFAPLTIILIIFILAMYQILNNRTAHVSNEFIMQVVENKRSEIDSSVELAVQEAEAVASMFTRLPEVVQAYETALQGDIDDPSSEQAQEAREHLRDNLSGLLQGFQNVRGENLRLHFHLPNGRSLVRLWRDKNSKQDGQWVDVSDDISNFRATVMHANQKQEPAQGIEVGRGGFTLRNVLPISDEQGNHLGSVEMLLDFNSIVQAAGSEDNQELLVYMNEDLLDIATELQDESKYPVLDDKYVQVIGPESEELKEELSADLLDTGLDGLNLVQKGSRALSFFPITDYTGEQVGVMAYILDTSQQQAVISNMTYTLMGVMAVLLLALIVAGRVIVGRVVLSPLYKVAGFAEDIAMGRNMESSLEFKNKDEINDLVQSVNKVRDNIQAIIQDVDTMSEKIRQGRIRSEISSSRYQGAYQELVEDINESSQVIAKYLEEVPSPALTMDWEYNVLWMNRAGREALNMNLEGVVNKKCHDLFRTYDCNTESCACRRAMSSGQSVSSETQAFPGDKQLDIFYNGLPIKDREQNIIGAMEFITDLTQIKTAQRKMQEVASKAVNIADSVSSAGEELSSQVEQSSQGTEEQTKRISETASSMEEMNATILEVAQNASYASQQSDEAKSQAQEGAKVVQEAVQSINEVQDQTRDLKQTMGKLSEQSEQIGRVMEVIEEIADQTNLLALNAAIEAARAGDAGRGFAVVADEVRKLAEKTMSATKEVGEVISSIRNSTQESVQNMDNTSQVVDKATDMANKSGQALQEIISLTEKSADQIRSIATASEEQSSASEEVNKNMEDINRIAKDNADAMNQSAQAVSDLAQQASELQKVIQELKQEG
ncbi:MAG: methyl-accepting chemotaxis protein [Desulfohalobiaceae bacterium]